ncbi:hypothetical protein GCM10009771_18020 [Nesterenkonia flava]
MPSSLTGTCGGLERPYPGQVPRSALQHRRRGVRTRGDAGHHGGQLLEKAPQGITEEAVQNDPTVAAVIGGTDVQDAIAAGAGVRPVDSNGNPWTADYVTASGNLLADFTSNVNAEMQGRI